MRSSRAFFPIGLLLLVTLVLAACGSTSSTTSGSYSSSSATPTATTAISATPTSPTTTGKNYATPTTGTGNTNAATLKTASATVNGKAETILTNAQGMTLYYFTPDTKTTTACTTGCTGTWPPLLTTGSSAPTGPAALSGKLTAVANANGTQVQYEGHFLYTFAGDSAPGQMNGEGVAGKWFVATTSLM
ncbi:MAG: hypothetical protein NVS4B11_13540 [Ktedonobacteraceae bacterium]